MLFKDLVDVSKRVSGTTHKKQKTSLLAECLKRGPGPVLFLKRTWGSIDPFATQAYRI